MCLLCIKHILDAPFFKEFMILNYYTFATFSAMGLGYNLRPI
jgi:hypothetical protein